MLSRQFQNGQNQYCLACDAVEYATKVFFCLYDTVVHYVEKVNAWSNIFIPWLCVMLYYGRVITLSFSRQIVSKVQRIHR